MAVTKAGSGAAGDTGPAQTRTGERDELTSPRTDDASAKAVNVPDEDGETQETAALRQQMERQEGAREGNVPQEGEPGSQVKGNRHPDKDHVINGIVQD